MTNDNNIIPYRSRQSLKGEHKFVQPEYNAQDDYFSYKYHDGKELHPVLTVKCSGEFIWAHNAEELIEKEDFGEANRNFIKSLLKLRDKA